MGLAGTATAADLGGSIKDGAMPTLMQQSSARFYVRGDGAYASSDRPSLVMGGRFDLYRADMSGNWSAGGGVGYYMSKNWRTDFTFEQRFDADVTGSYLLDGGSGPVSSDGKVGLKSTLGLFNVYYDFDTRSRFTPYVGAGLGWVSHKASAGSFTDDCACSATVDSGSNTSAAGALMAGVAINLTGRGPAAGSDLGYGGGEVARNFYVDLGYRFLYLGEAQTGAVNTVVATVPTKVADSIAISDLHAHEFRVGLRYDFR